MGLGDELLAAGHAANVHRTMADRGDPRKISICDLRWRPRWHPLWDGNPIIASPGEVASGLKVYRIQNATGCRPYLHYPFTQDTGFRYVRGWRAQDHRTRIYLSEADFSLGTMLAASAPFVLIEPSLKGTQTRNKAWPFERYAALVAALPSVRFIRLVHEDDRPLPGALSMQASSSLEAIGVLAKARVYVGPEGGFHHAAAAVGTPAVVLFGGCIDPATMAYPEHVNLIDRGPGSPCGRYLPCDHCVRAMAGIPVSDVATAVLATLAGQVEGVA